MTTEQRNLIIKHLLSEDQRGEVDLLGYILNSFDAKQTCHKMVNYFHVLNGDNAWVNDNAIEFMEALLEVLVAMRDNSLLQRIGGNGVISVDLIHSFLNAPTLVEIIYNFYDFEKEGTVNKEYVNTLVDVLLRYGIDCRDKDKKPSSIETDRIFGYTLNPWKYSFSLESNQ